jgi:hypothetical protein
MRKIARQRRRCGEFGGSGGVSYLKRTGMGRIRGRLIASGAFKIDR